LKVITNIITNILLFIIMISLFKIGGLLIEIRDEKSLRATAVNHNNYYDVESYGAINMGEKIKGFYTKLEEKEK